jgi:hypothetical protein
MSETTSSFTDSLSNTSQGAYNTTKNLTKNIFKGSKGMLNETGTITKGTLKGATNLAKNTINRSSRIANKLLSGEISGTLNASKDLLTETASEISEDINKSLKYGLSNPYVSTTIKVLLAMYAAFAAPNLPKGISKLFDNTIVRIIVTMLIVYVATKDSSMAILLALAFILTLQTASKHKVIDTSNSVSPEGQLSWLPSVKNPISENFSNYTSEEHLDSESETEGEYAPALAHVDATGEQIGELEHMTNSESESLMNHNEMNHQESDHL